MYQQGRNRPWHDLRETSMRIRSLLLGSMAAAGLAMALATASASAYDIMVTGPSLDGQFYIGDTSSGVDTLMINSAGSMTMHGSGLVDLTNVGLDGYNLVAMNDSITDDAWLSIGNKLYGATGKYLLNDEVGLGVPLGYDVIQMVPTAGAFGDMAMIKGAACAPVDSGGVLAISAGYKLDVAKTLGHVLAFGATGWSSASAISAVGNTCNEQLPGLQIG